MSEGSQLPKEPYEKPALKKVPLRPEEAVLGACKSMSVSGPGDGASCAVIACYNAGS